MSDPLTRLSYLRWDKMGQCTRCRLHEEREKIVFGEGSPEADVVIIGEAPGANEDRLGRPFVGKAGKLLDAMLQKAGLARDQVYITNVVKCRPPRNRDPEKDEVAACIPFLHVQMWVLRPKAIVTLGRYAGNVMTGNDSYPMGRLAEGDTWTYKHPKGEFEVPVYCLYHPAYMLRLGRGELRDLTIVNSVQSIRFAADGAVERLSDT